MFHHSLHEPISRKVAFNWFLVSFLSGSVNAGGYLACGRFVSHVTGFATLFGVEAAHNRWDVAIGILSVPMYFLIGVMISAYLIDRPYHQRRRPHYATAMFLVAACLIAASLLGHFAFFGVFGEGIHLTRDYFLLALLCGASGLQNAALTTASGATVRTTHLTGITTDLGIGLVRAFTLKPDPKHYSFEKRLAKLRMGTVGAFATGSAVGAALFLKIEYLGFLLPAAIALYAMLVALVEDRHHTKYTSLHPG